MPITINKVLHSVTRKLAELFPDAQIYNEEAPQDLDPPAFFVKLLQVEQEQELGVRYWRYHSFDIHYFDPGYKNVSMHDVAEQLYDHLRLIEVDGRPTRGTSMNHEIVDRVLHFFVDYNIRVREDVPLDPTMQQLEFKEGVDGDYMPAWLPYPKVNLDHYLKPRFDLNASSTDFLNELLGPNIRVPKGGVELGEK